MLHLAALRALPWRWISYGILALACAAFLALWQYEQERSAKFEAQAEKCATARAADRRAYESAQREAAARNKAHVARVEAEQEKITNDITSSLSARLERLRRELRQQGTSAPQSSAGGTGTSSDGEPRTGADEEAGVCASPEKFLRAAENEERHDRLIDWVERQLQIRR